VELAAGPGAAVKTRTLLLVLALVAVAAWLSRQWLVAVTATAATAGVYGWSLWRHPWWPCRACDGSKSHRDSIWPKATGRCRKCDNKGQFPRLGVKVFTPSRAQGLTSGVRGRYG
jgi:hypothetical protein